jgi:hypothetical protein
VQKSVDSDRPQHEQRQISGIYLVENLLVDIQRYIIFRTKLNVLFLVQGKTKSGALQFDLVTNRNGKKYYVKPRPALKDISWKDSIASSTLQVRFFKLLIVVLNILSQAFAERALPDSSLPLGCELKTRKKTAEKPEKTAAIANHQSRMKRSACEDS